MKRSMMILLVIVALAPASLWAQAPKAEIYGGFSAISLETGTGRTTPLGWQAAISGRMTDRFSFVGDFAGQYKNGVDLMEYLGGVRMTHNLEKASVFGHALFGGSRASSPIGSSSAFTMGYGGGIDVNATNKVGIRVLQFDWLPMHGGGEWSTDTVRFGFGIVYKLGS
jgi:hypothetical protein